MNTSIDAMVLFLSTIPDIIHLQIYQINVTSNDWSAHHSHSPLSSKCTHSEVILLVLFTPIVHLIQSAGIQRFGRVLLQNITSSSLPLVFSASFRSLDHLSWTSLPIL